MKKDGRLQSATKWIKEYSGKNIVKGYAKWYGTSKLQAVRELQLLGIVIDEEYINQLKICEENVIKRNREKREKRAELKRIEEEELKSFRIESDHYEGWYSCDDDDYLDLKNGVVRNVSYEDELPF